MAERIVTVQFLVQIPDAEDCDEVTAELAGEVEHAVQKLRLTYSDVEIVEGDRRG